MICESFIEVGPLGQKLYTGLKIINLREVESPPEAPQSGKP